MIIRKTTANDIDKLLEIFDYAREYMKANNNPNQWVDGYPSRENIEQDIQKNESYVCLDDDNNIIATFCFFVGIEEDYNEIYEGKWLNNNEYGVIHRIATLKNKKGVGSFCIKYCFDICKNMRVDTHKDNIPMQRLLDKESFTKCGIIRLRRNKAERIAFQKVN